MFQRGLAIYFLVETFLYLWRFIAIYRVDITTFGILYSIRFYGAKAVPLVAFTGYLMATTWTRWQRIGNAISTFVFFGSLITGIIVVGAWVTHTPLAVFLGLFRWHYVALLEYIFAFIGFVALAYWRISNKIVAVTIGILGVSAASMIYELPLYPTIQHTDIYFHATHPLFIATPIFSCLGFAYILYMHKRSFGDLASDRNRVIALLASISLYLLWSIIYFFNPHTFTEAIPRIPALLMLATFIGVIPSNRNGYSP